MGDTFFFATQVQNLDVTKTLGRYNAACVHEDGATSLNRCTATVFLKGGKIELAGRVKLPETSEGFRFAVIGETGRYDNVVGQGKVTFGCRACPEGTEADMLTLNLIPSLRRP